MFTYFLLILVFYYRLWEDGWKDRYYKSKFDVDSNDIEFRHNVVSTVNLQSSVKNVKASHYLNLHDNNLTLTKTTSIECHLFDRGL